MKLDAKLGIHLFYVGSLYQKFTITGDQLGIVL